MTKYLIVLFALATVIVTAHAQQSPPAEPPSSESFHIEIIPDTPQDYVNPVPDLTQRDMVEILTDYMLVHEPPTAYFTDSVYGLTDPKARIIHIFSKGDHTEKRDTIIHEMLHIRCSEQHKDCSEDEIGARSKEIYERLFLAK